MNTDQEKLQKIRAKCEKLLAIAEKRTPGEWMSASETVWARNERVGGQMETDDAAFIAACAGPAEAGWRATIAAIDGLLATMKVRNLIYHEVETMNGILSAWPDELLK